MYEENNIIRDARVLKEQFIPSRILYRDGQLDSIRNCLKPILNEMKPRSIFMFGDPGTGKTCISRFVAEELSAHSASVQNSYINCWECSSRFKILYRVLQDIGLSISVHRKGTPTDEVLENIKKRLTDNYCVIILDEVDKLEDDRILYDLAGIENACILLISNSETALHNADPRVRSRLASSEHLQFSPYTNSEIAGILRDRREWGLVPGVISNEQLERIANASDGDSRVAISTLSIVAEEAENNDLEKITNALIENALPKAMQSSTERSLEMLAPQQRLIIELLKSKESINTGELFRVFKDTSSKRGFPDVVDRTFRKYVDRLVQMGFVRSQGEARWRVYSLEEPLKTTIQGN